MKQIFLTLIISCSLASSALAAQVQFRGAILITAATQACLDNDDAHVGDFFDMRYSPPNVGDNGVSTRMTLLDLGCAQNFTLASGSLIGTTFRTVSSAFICRGAGTGTAQMRITAQSPANLSAANFANITGNINTFFDPGCNVQFRGAGVRK